MNREQLGYLASFGFGGMDAHDVLHHLSDIGYKGVGWTLAHSSRYRGDKFA